jgi:flagellar FliL protein
MMMQNEIQAKKSNRWMIVIIILLLVIIALGIGFIAIRSDEGFFGIGGESEPEEVYIPLDEFLVNIEGDGMVRMEITLTSYEESAEQEVTENIAKVRDSVIHVLTNRSTENIYDESDGDFVIKQEIRNRINAGLNKEVVDDVFITNILLQN